MPRILSPSLWYTALTCALAGGGVDDGRDRLFYADAHTGESTIGKLVEGQKYVMIARESSNTMNGEDTLSFDLLSFQQIN